MRTYLQDALALLGLLVAGAGLLALAVNDHERFLALSPWVVTLGFLLATLAGLTGRSIRAPQTAGRLPLLVGLFLLALSAGVPLGGNGMESVSRLLAGGGELDPALLALTLQAVGALGIAFGAVFWTSALVRGAAATTDLPARLDVERGRLEEQVRLQANQLKRAVVTDEQTGVLSRRSFLERLDEVIRRDSRLRQPMVLLVVTVPASPTSAGASDVGPESAMRTVARALQGATRGTDVVGRPSEELLGAVLGECEDPAPAAERLLEALAAVPVLNPGSATPRAHVAAVTVKRPEVGLTFAELFQLAEEALASLPPAAPSQWVRREYRSPSEAGATAG